MNLKTITITFFILLLLVISVWVYHSYDYGELLIFSRDAKFVELTTYDDLLMTESTELVSVEGFWLGLLPSVDKFSPKVLLAVVPLGSICLMVAIISLILFRRKLKNVEEI